MSILVRAFERVRAGERTLIPERILQPLTSVPNVGSLTPSDNDGDVLGRTAVLKLNGGIGTNYGTDGPKSPFQAHGGQTFLDIALRQIVALRERYGVALPFILLNSNATAARTEALGSHRPQRTVSRQQSFNRRCRA